MNDIQLYEKIPHAQFPVRILIFRENRYDFPLHWHEHTEMHYIFKGTGKLKCGESVLELQEGDLAITNGNELHQGLGGKCDYICLIVPPAFFEQNHSIFDRVIRDAYVSELVEKIYEHHLLGENTDLLEIKGNMYFLISHLIRNYTVKLLGETVYSGYVNRLNRVNKIIKYMDSHYDKPLSTKALASMAHLSEGYFCHLFKEVTGKTAMEHLNNIRVDKAEELLKKTEMTAAEIAYCCGFDDPNYFSRIYKKMKGHTPLSTRHFNKDN